MYVIAGLGNPGAKYENTRHNVGFDVIDVLSEKLGIRVSTKKCHALLGEGFYNGNKYLLVKPQTFMNLSGESIREVLEYYDVPVENLLVISDDVYLGVGEIRLRKNGSAGGHNGLKNIILELATDDFKRLRLGVGIQPEKIDRVSYVLSHFTKEERETLNDGEEAAASACICVFEENMDKAMGLYNGKRNG